MFLFSLLSAAKLGEKESQILETSKKTVFPGEEKQKLRTKEVVKGKLQVKIYT